MGEIDFFFSFFLSASLRADGTKGRQAALLHVDLELCKARMISPTSYSQRHPSCAPNSQSCFVTTAGS